MGPQASYHAWNESNLAKAIEAKSSGYSYRRAAEIFGVPMTTLYDHMTENVANGAQSGPKPYLTPEEEEELARFVI